MGALPRTCRVPPGAEHSCTAPTLAPAMSVVTSWPQLVTLKHWAVGPMKPARVDVGMGLAAGKARPCDGGYLVWVTKPDP